MIVSMSCMALNICAYALIDFTQKPKFLMKFKIQPDKNVPPSIKEFRKVVTRVFINQTLNLPFLMITYYNWRGGPGNIISYVPNIYVTLGHVFVGIFTFDLLFYHLHR